MKACPGLRSGINRSSSLSLVIRGIPSSFRPFIRHSGESRNPEGWGEGIVALGLVPSLGRTARSRTLHRPASHHFHPLMRPSQGHGDSRESRNPGVVYRLQMTRKHLHQSTPRFSYLGAPAAPAWAIGTKACPGLRSGMDGSRHDRWNPLALVIPAPQFVIPAKAGIQRGGVGCGNDTRTLPPTNATNFHTVVWRQQPA